MGVYPIKKSAMTKNINFYHVLTLLVLLSFSPYINAEAAVDDNATKYYSLVTNAEDLAEGDEIIIVSSFTIDNVEYNYAMGAAKYNSSNKPSYNYSGIEVNPTDDVVATSDAEISTFTLQKESSGWVLKDKNNNYLYAACFTRKSNGDANALWFQTKIDKYCYMSIDISSDDNHYASMKFSDSSLKKLSNQIGLTSETGTAGIFNCYKSLGVNEHDVSIYKRSNPSLTINETDSNMGSVLSGSNGKVYNVSLTRTFYANKLHTICLPFCLSAEQIKETFGAASILYGFSKVDEQGYMVFSPSADGIEAGTPYLLLTEKGIDNPSFRDITITADSPKTIKQGSAKFCGNYAPYEMKTDGSEKFLNSNGKLIAPAETTNKMRGLRAYFSFTEAVSGASEVSLSQGGTSDIANSVRVDRNSDIIHSVSGVAMGKDQGSLMNGMYVINGKKVLIERR